LEALPEVADQPFAGILDTVRTTGEPYIGNEAQVELSRHGDESVEAIYVNFVYEPLRGPDGAVELIFVHAVDVSDLVRARQAAQDAVRTRDEFLAAAAHDLRTPLASTKGIAQLLKKRVQRMQLADGDGERLVEGLDRIDQSVGRMSALIDELLDLARVQMGGPIELERQPTDLDALMRQAVADQTPNAPRHQFRVQASGTPLVGDWDPVRLRRAFDNLLSNAVKYSPEGGDIIIGLAREATDGGEVAVVRVTDHGVGIPAADLPHVFERFRRGGNVAFAQGTGIGLGVVHSIVQQHGGSIEVDSVEGQGSTFTVRLPLG
jgi:signal transduction histidine kinase